MAGNTNAQTVNFLKKLGIDAETVERWLPYGRVTKDFLSFADIIGFNQFSSIAIQATTKINRTTRIKKIKANHYAPKWLQSPFRKIWIITWSKRKRLDCNGRNREQWTARIDEMFINENGELDVETLNHAHQ